MLIFVMEIKVIVKGLWGFIFWFNIKFLFDIFMNYKFILVM